MEITHLLIVMVLSSHDHMQFYLRQWYSFKILNKKDDVNSAPIPEFHNFTSNQPRQEAYPLELLASSMELDANLAKEATDTEFGEGVICEG
jgi:hypothetical protein